MSAVIIGGGIGGLAAALFLHERGLACHVYESAPEIKPLGVGINLLPHATGTLALLGLEDALCRAGVETREMAFFDHRGKLIYREAMGRLGGFPHPQVAIHRAELHRVLLEAVRARLGQDAVVLGQRCTGVEQDERSVRVHFIDVAGGGMRRTVAGGVAIGADGFHSVVRAQLHPQEGPPRYAGINMWRGTTVLPPFLTGASMVTAGSLRSGRMVIFPIRNNVDGAGAQLVNWMAEVKSDAREANDWNRQGRMMDFFPRFAEWHFDWLHVPAMIEGADQVLEYPMVDRDPLPRWSFGRVTLLGDAAHPMYPRGTNGAAQAILDAECLGRCLDEIADPVVALTAYERERLPATARVVTANRTTPPDYIIETVYDRTQGRPFERIEDVIDREELAEILANYQRIAGWDRGEPPRKG